VNTNWLDWGKPGNEGFGDCGARHWYWQKIISSLASNCSRQQSTVIFDGWYVATESSAIGNMHECLRGIKQARACHTLPLPPLHPSVTTEGIVRSAFIRWRAASSLYPGLLVVHLARHRIYATILRAWLLIIQGANLNVRNRYFSECGWPRRQLVEKSYWINQTYYMNK